MKATLNVIPPVPVAPKKTVTIELSYEEAQDLLRVCNWSGKVTRLVNDTSSGDRKVVNEQSLYKLFEALDNAGVGFVS